MGGTPPPPLLLLPPPQLRTPLVRAVRSISNPSVVRKARRRAGKPNSRTHATTALPAEGQNSFNGLLRAVAAVVFTVSVTVCDAVPLIVTEAGWRLHAAGSLAAGGEMAQNRLTCPVKPLNGAIVIVELLPVVAPGEMVSDAPAMEK